MRGSTDFYCLITEVNFLKVKIKPSSNDMKRAASLLKIIFNNHIYLYCCILDI